MVILNPAKRDRDILKCYINNTGKIISNPDKILEACL